MLNKKILFLTLLGILVLPVLVFAQGGGSGVSIESMVDAAVQTTLYIASGIIVILWVMTGIIFLTAQGAPEKLSTGKKALIASIAGTVLIIVASGAINLIKGAFKL